LNIGAAARAMSNFGFRHLRLVQPYDAAWREARSAVGAQAVLAGAGVFPSLAAAVADCTLVVGTAGVSRRDLKHTVRRLEAAAPLIRRRLRAGHVALVFGSEKFGLSNEDLSHCHWLLRVPTRAGHESMNLGQAVALCLYELVRDSAATRRQPAYPRLANAADLNRLEQVLGGLLLDSGYFEERTSGSSRLKLRRLLRRMQLEHDDVPLWLGMFRQIRWRFDKE
jgi:tRNA/rRNA methyltransferase